MISSHRLITFGRIIHSGLLNFIRNAWLTTAATAIMTVTLTILLATLIFNKALGDTINEYAKDITISVYLRDEADLATVNRLGEELKQNTEVKGVAFINKEEAQSRYINRYKEDNQRLLDAISIAGNSFPASWEVELKNLSQNQSVVAFVSQLASQPMYSSIVDKIDKERLTTVTKIGEAQRFIIRAGIIAGSVFAIISILVIFNTIRMAIFTRSSEITIMRLIGATNGYIRGPFLFESMLYGIVAALLSTSLTFITLTTLGPKVEQHVRFESTITLFERYWYVVLFGTMGLGILVGVSSSILAMTRYMKK